MTYTIKKAQEDYQGNAKDNIRIAVDELNHFLGSGYIYVNINEDIASVHPLNIYIDITVLNDDTLSSLLAEDLFKELYAQAQEVRKDYKHLRARLYYGCLTAEDKKLSFFLSKGFAQDEATHQLRLNVIDYIDSNKRLEGVVIKENSLNKEDSMNAVIELHNSILFRPLDKEALESFNTQPYAKHFTALVNDAIVGHIMLYAKEDSCGALTGVIENLFVVKPYRSQNIARHCVDTSIRYFKQANINTVILEVWNINTVAYKFYEKLGFKKTKDTELYAGITL